MAHTSIFIIPEILEQVLHFLVVDKSLYPTLFVCRLWYRCGAPILWRCIKLKRSNARKIFMEIIHGGQKPVYCLNVIHLEIPFYHFSDKNLESIASLFPNIVHLNLFGSEGFSDKILNLIAESYPNLKYLNLGGRGDRLITDKGLYAIANSCHKLEYLSISDRKEFTEIAIWNVIHSCPKIQKFDIYGCKISYTAIEKIGLYLKIKYINPGTATRYLEKIGRSQTCFSSSSSEGFNLSEIPNTVSDIRIRYREHFNRQSLHRQITCSRYGY